MIALLALAALFYETPSPAPTASPSPPASTASPSAGSALPTPAPSLSAPPTPTPFPQPTLLIIFSTASCANPNLWARGVKIVQPVYSNDMWLNRKEGTVDVRVFLSSNGMVRKALIAVSSGDASLDAAAYHAAIATTYAPEIKDCIPIAGSYIYRVFYRP